VKLFLFLENMQMETVLNSVPKFILMRFFKGKKEAPKEVRCNCSLCGLMNSIEPNLKNKTYENSLRRFVLTPTSIDRPLKEIEEEARKFEKMGQIEGARASYNMLAGVAIGSEKVPIKDVESYLNEYLKFFTKHKLSKSDYYPSKEDLSNVMKHLDEILKIVRVGYQKLSPKT
jgi:hypothetical protein